MRLSIDPNIVPKWGIWEALREIVQGAIDYSNEYKIDYNPDTQRLIIENEGMLSRSSLLIGHSDKRDNKNTIGEHGEGYKLAAAILLRNNKKFHIYNNKEIWSFSYKYDRRFKTNVIDININKWFVQKTNLITWEIYNITQEEYDEFQNKLIKTGDIRGTNAWILLDKPGVVFSGGLYVCTRFDLTFGYNFDVGILELQRDRDLISDFDIFWSTSKAWDGLDDVAAHIRDGLNDVKYINSTNSINKERKNAVTKMFYSDYGYDANPCTCESDKIDGANNIIVNDVYKETIKSSDNYIPLTNIKTQKPYEILNDWWNNGNPNMLNFDKILKLSVNWKINYETEIIV